MSKTAEEILQKHVPNRFPKDNPYIDAMIEYAYSKDARIEDLEKRLEEAEKLLRKSRSYFNTRDCFGDIISDIDNHFN